MKVIGRVVLRGNVVKDDSGSYAMFTEAGIPSVSNDGGKSSGRDSQTTRMIRKSKRRSVISLLPSQKGRRSDIIDTCGIGMPDIVGSTTSDKDQDTAVPLDRNLNRHQSTGLVWERPFEKSLDSKWMDEGSRMGTLI